MAKAATKKATKAAPKVATKAAHKVAPAGMTPSIPSVQRPQDILKAKLAAMRGPKAAPPKASKKSERPEVNLDEEATQEAIRFIPAKVCWDYVDNYTTVHKKLLETHLRELYVNTLWAKKSQPENPAVKVRDDKGRTEFEMIFILQDRFSVQMPEVGDDEEPADAMRNFLIASGMEAENASKLVANELKWKVDQTIPLEGDEDPEDPLSELRMLVRIKLVEFITGETAVLELDDTERALLVIAKTNKAEVRDGFLERVALYCSSLEELTTVLTIIKPVAQNNGAKAWESIDPAVRKQNLVEMFQRIIAAPKSTKKS